MKAKSGSITPTRQCRLERGGSAAPSIRGATAPGGTHRHLICTQCGAESVDLLSGRELARFTEDEREALLRDLTAG
jgi:hypothetical protein